MPPVQSCTRWPIAILATAPASGQQVWPAANPNLQQANKREQQIILHWVGVWPSEDQVYGTYPHLWFCLRLGRQALRPVREGGRGRGWGRILPIQIIHVIYYLFGIVFFYSGLKSIAGYHFASLHCRMVLLLVLRYKKQPKEAKSHVLFSQEMQPEEQHLNRLAEFEILVFSWKILCMKVFTVSFFLLDFFVHPVSAWLGLQASMEAGKLLTCDYANHMLHLHSFFFMDCNVVLGLHLIDCLFCCTRHGSCLSVVFFSK